ncbi:MAG: helix-turn-helix domain-containing protein [Hamadaea sp.]|nr:helix-turn-helix domain-containing protein [Hamadaea sp.]
MPLHRPPVVANAGAAVHGTAGLQDAFLLPDLWQVHLYAYAGELTLGGIAHPIRPGHVSLIPPGAPVHFRYRGRSEHLYLHLRLPRADASHRPGEPGTPGGTEEPQDVAAVPVMQDAGDAADVLATMFRSAIAAAPHQPAHAAAEAWTALWRIAQLPQPGRSHHLVVLRAMEFVEARLGEPITVPQIARHADVSHNHLTRLFRAETGMTVVGYLRRRRLARAEHLLRHTTLPIPAVAAAVGIADLQAFNKACRRELGASPRAVRGRG